MTMQALANTNNVPQIEQKSPSQASTNLLSNAFLAKQQQAPDEFRSESKEQNIQKPSLKLKAGVFAATLAGVSLVMLHTFKKKGLSINLAKAFKTSPKEWSLFKVKYGQTKADKFELPKLVTKLAFGSVGGGFLGGMLFDKKENLKAKGRESVIQMIGNIFTPLICVTSVMGLFEKVEGKVVKTIVPTVKNAKLQNCLNGLPGVIVTMATLAAGIFIGNRVGNTINQKVFLSKEDRKLKLGDMSPHIDDVCVAASLVDAKGVVGTQLARLVPAALMIAGVSTGLAQECPQHPSISSDSSVKPEVSPAKDSTTNKPAV